MSIVLVAVTSTTHHLSRLNDQPQAPARLTKFPGEPAQLQQPMRQQRLLLLRQRQLLGPLHQLRQLLGIVRPRGGTQPTQGLEEVLRSPGCRS